MSGLTPEGRPTPEGSRLSTEDHVLAAVVDLLRVYADVAPEVRELREDVGQLRSWTADFDARQDERAKLELARRHRFEVRLKVGGAVGMVASLAMSGLALAHGMGG